MTFEPDSRHVRLSSILGLTAILLSVLVGLSGFAALPGHAAAAPSLSGPPFAWQVERIDTHSDTGLYTSLALNRLGDPVIFYLDNTNSTLRLARFTNESWTSSAVDGPGMFVGATSVVVAPNGTVQVAYYDLQRKEVTYAIETSTGWDHTVVGPGFTDGYERLALDNAGRPAIVYSDYTGQLHYATWNGTAWNSELVDGTQILCQYVDLTFNAQNEPQISYAGDVGLYYATKVNGVWTHESVDPSEFTGWFSRIRVDSQGNPHIAYYASANGSLMYASRTGGTWNRVVVDRQGDSGWDLSLAIDSQDRPQIAYYKRVAGTLSYAILDEGRWILETVDNDGVVGWYTGLAVDASDLPHISYYDWSDGNLRYAVGAIALQVRTARAAALGATSILLRGELVALGNYSSANVSFSVRLAGTVNWTAWPVGVLSSAGFFSLTLSNLTSGATYQFRAQATAGNATSVGGLQSAIVPTPEPPPVPYLLYAGVAVVVIIAGTIAFVFLRRWRHAAKKKQERRAT